MQQVKEFKARASAAGKLMVSGRAKGEIMGKTAYSYVEEWLKEQIYGVSKSIKSKYLDKGIELEDAAIDKAIQVLDLPFVLKNETSYEDEFFTGTPDIVTDTDVIDIKCSWDCFTFPLFEAEIPTKDYYYQLQVYMHLTGRKSARLVYMLLDTPSHIEWEAVSYENVEDRYKVKVYEVAYDATVIDDLKERVNMAREYISEITKSL